MYAANVPSSATNPQMNGDRTAGTITDCTRLWTFTAPEPLATIVAPITPPIRACDELDGIVRYQVIRFHIIAPSNAASTSTKPSPPASTLGFTIPFAIVAATLIEMNAPAKFRHADIKTATRGFNAPVAIDVATAFAVSWKPFVKSNARPPTTTRMRISSEPMRGESADLAQPPCKQIVTIPPRRPGRSVLARDLRG